MINLVALKNISNLGREFKLLLHLFLNVFTLRNNLRQFLSDIFFTGTLSVLIITISGFFVGLVLGLQGYETLKDLDQRGSWNYGSSFINKRTWSCHNSYIIFRSCRLCNNCKNWSDEIFRSTYSNGNDVCCTLKKIYVPIFYAGVFSVPMLTGIFVRLVY